MFCTEMNTENNYLDGEKTQLLHYFPLSTPYRYNDLFTYDYENPVYFNLKYSTDNLHFKLCDKDNNELPITDVLIELLLK